MTEWWIKKIRTVTEEFVIVRTQDKPHPRTQDKPHRRMKLPHASRITDSVGKADIEDWRQMTDLEVKLFRKTGDDDGD